MILKKLRTQHRMSQSALGAACDTSRDRVALWENGIQKPRLDYQIKLSRCFKIPLVELQKLCDWPLTPHIIVVGLSGVTV